jgi:hypothetical protein
MRTSIEWKTEEIELFYVLLRTRGIARFLSRNHHHGCSMVADYKKTAAATTDRP